ncbi:trypsin [Bombus terrestris]|uniref:chymotrypsin n=1 Tax=Bombus terrestris TaxID=30195 RepID=A0A9B0C2Z6_BOMTE|nr:trypsin [Bombus terrestris]
MKMRIIALVLAVAFIVNSFVDGGLLPQSTTTETTETTVNPNSQAEWTHYNLHGRIVNGTKAALRQFPYQVSLRESYSNSHFCGGSLIDEQYVLTAAHCMFEESDSQIQPWTIIVVAGDIKLSQQSQTGQRRGVDKIYVHPKFNMDTLENDVALLALKVPFALTPEVNIAPLATHTPVPETICQVAGWGYPAEDYPITSENLMYIDLPLLSHSTCKKLLENITDFPAGMLCAGYIEGQRDACQGDSGGGMICGGFLTGVVSGGDGCARPRTPGVYTDVYFYRLWIASHLDTNPTSQYSRKRNNSGSEQVVTTTLLPSVLLSVLFHI